MNNRKQPLICQGILSILLLGSVLSAQDFIPERSGVILLGDRFGDRVWALNDFDFDFTTEQPGEAIPWYTGVNGPAIPTIQDIGVTEDGRALVVESANRQVVWLRNQNLDSDADDPGESGIFFDNGNAPGTLFGALFGISVQAGTPTTVHVAASGNGTFSNDRVITLRDANGDGDANDGGESRVFWDNPTSVASGNPDISIPSAIHVDSSGRVFLLQAVNSGASAGVYELTDLNGDFDANDAGEVTTYFLIPNGNPAAFDMTPARDGRLFVTDRGTVDSIYVLDDMNGDGDVSDPGESNIYWSPSTTTLIDNLCEYVLADGSTALLAAEDGGDDRVLLLNDINGNGVIDNATEEITLHDTANPGVVDIGQPKAIEALPGPSLTGPPQVAIGQTATATHRGIHGQTLFVGYSFTTFPISAPPYGIYHLGTYPPLGFSVPFAVVPPSGAFSIPFTVPNLAWLSGLTIDTQSYEYDGFFGRLSQLYRITIM